MTPWTVDLKRTNRHWVRMRAPQGLNTYAQVKSWLRRQLERAKWRGGRILFRDTVVLEL